MSDIKESEEEVIARHRKEVRDLTATITGMKKQATKGEKKKKKEILKQTEQMEADLKTRHEQELKAARGETGGDDDDGEDEEQEITPEMLLARMGLDDKQADKDDEERPAQQQQQPVASQSGKKRNRRKEKLAKREEEEQKMRDEAAAELADKPDLRQIELDNLEQVCKMQGVEQYDIVPDGHCLFASIADQLKVRHNVEVTVQELRHQAAEHIRADPNSYAPFLFNEETLTMREIGPYCDELENTAIWGGDMEILALANVYDCPTSVLFSGRSTHRVNEEGKNPELKLVYYKHSYSLGAHYNSLRDA